MKRSQKRQPNYKEEKDSDDGSSSPVDSNLAPAARPTGTGGKQPVTAAGGNKVPPRPTTAGKQPNTAVKPGTGGKQPDISPQTIAALKRGTAISGNNKGQPAAGTGGKGPAGATRAQTRAGTGGKEPVKKDNTAVSSNMRPRSKPGTLNNKARPQTHRKQHPLIGKTVRVYYVPEGYYNGVVKSQFGENEFMIHWEDGSTTSAVLREEDETEDPDNEDRWSVVDDYLESDRVERKPKNGGRSQSKQTAPPVTKGKPQPSKDDDDEENDNENEQDNDNEDNDPEDD